MAAFLLSPTRMNIRRRHARKPTSSFRSRPNLRPCPVPVPTPHLGRFQRNRSTTATAYVQSSSPVVRHRSQRRVSARLFGHRDQQLYSLLLHQPIEPRRDTNKIGRVLTRVPTRCLARNTRYVRFPHPGYARSTSEPLKGCSSFPSRAARRMSSMNRLMPPPQSLPLESGATRPGDAIRLAPTGMWVPVNPSTAATNAPAFSIPSSCHHAWSRFSCHRKPYRRSSSSWFRAITLDTYQVAVLRVPPANLPSLVMQHYLLPPAPHRESGRPQLPKHPHRSGGLRRRK